MKFLSSVVLGIGACVALFAINTLPVHAENVSLSDVQRQRIQSNCTQIKGTVERLHASDALLRVNRGQAYEAISGRLMAPFNTRLNLSGLDNKAMTTRTSQYQAALVLFRDNYSKYEKRLAVALKIDCSKSPDEFHAAILEARVLRKNVHDDVQKLHRSMDDYGTSVGDFMLNFKRLSQ